MKILLTGASGFLGGVLKESFQASHEITTIGRTEADLFFDFARSEKIEGTVPEECDLLIHVAGKAHIYPKSQEEIDSFFKINHDGTRRLLDALEGIKVKRFVFISTISVYGRDWGESIDENHPLEGDSPYALSKIKAEQEVQKWAESKSIPYLILRLPLIAGSNPPGNLRKMIDGLKTRKYLRIGGGKARKSMVMASDIATLIIQPHEESGIYNLSDGYHPSFFELEQLICKRLSLKAPISIPIWMGNCLGLVGDIVPSFPVNSVLIKKMTLDLSLDDTKARNELGWNPNKVLDTFEPLKP